MNQGPLPRFELYPPGILDTAARQTPDVTQLRTAGGIVEVVDKQELTSFELRVVMSVAAGLQNAQINKLSSGYAACAMTNVFDKLGVSDRESAVNALFTNRIVRVIKPIAKPCISEQSRELLERRANGEPIEHIAETENVSSRAIRYRKEKLYAAFGTDIFARLVLLGHLGGILPPSNDIASIETLDQRSICRIAQGSALSKPHPSGVHFDYVAWEGSAFSFHKDTSLSYQEQRSLLLAAIGTSRQEAAEILHTSKKLQTDSLTSAAEKLSARNTVHALTKAMERGDIRTTYHIPKIGLTKPERMSLTAAALGRTTEDTEFRIGKGGSTARNLNAHILQKMGVSNITAAVMKAYLSKDLDLDELTSTYAA